MPPRTLDLLIMFPPSSRKGGGSQSVIAFLDVVGGVSEAIAPRVTHQAFSSSIVASSEADGCSAEASRWVDQRANTSNTVVVARFHPTTLWSYTVLVLYGRVR